MTLAFHPDLQYGVKRWDGLPEPVKVCNAACGAQNFDISPSPS